MAKVEQKHLGGLTFRTSVKKEVMEDGRKKARYVPAERPLALDDLLTERDDGSTFHIVTKDGRKYDVPKAAAKGDKDNEK